MEFTLKPFAREGETIKCSMLHGRRSIYKPIGSALIPVIAHDDEQRRLAQK